MSGVGIRVRTEGADRVSAYLAGVVGRIEHPRDMLDAIGAALAVSTQHRFEDEKAPSGNPWPKSIRALAEGGKTLTKSGRLVQSITHEASDKGVAIGTNVIYAAIHQFGGTIVPKSAPALAFKIGAKWVFTQKVTIPARPFLGLDAEDETEITAIIDAFLLGPQAEASADAG